MGARGAARRGAAREMTFDSGRGGVKGIGIHRSGWFGRPRPTRLTRPRRARNRIRAASKRVPSGEARYRNQARPLRRAAAYIAIAIMLTIPLTAMAEVRVCGHELHGEVPVAAPSKPVPGPTGLARPPAAKIHPNTSSSSWPKRAWNRVRAGVKKGAQVKLDGPIIASENNPGPIWWYLALIFLY